MPGMLDVVAIGNAIVDILSFVDLTFLDANNLLKGRRMLVDEKRSEELYHKVTPSLQCAGGSAANSMAGLASLGGKGAFIGRVKADLLGTIFSKAIRKDGLVFNIPPSVEGPATGRCLVFVTPDAERTMQTHLGASVDLTDQDVDVDVIERSKIVYVEGYLFRHSLARNAAFKAIKVARLRGCKVALAACEVRCIQEDRLWFNYLMENQYVDILIANEWEMMALLKNENFDEMCSQARQLAPVVAITRGVKGSVILTPQGGYQVIAANIGRVVDTTGAGDLYAGGFLFGIAQGYDLLVCAQIATLAAAEVISHLGARPQVPLSSLKQQLLSGQIKIPVSQLF